MPIPQVQPIGYSQIQNPYAQQLQMQQMQELNQMQQQPLNQNEISSQPGNNLAGYAQFGNIGAGVIDATNTDNNKWANLGSGALKGAATGAAMGSFVPGIGTAIGAGVGALAGGITSVMKGNAEASAQKEAQLTQQKLMDKQLVSQSANQFNQVNSMYELGGNLNGITQYNGLNHNQGGLQLGNTGKEVETGETRGLGRTKDFVFSDKLISSKGNTFADNSKKIEKKYKDAENDRYAIESKDKELDELAKEQEQLKSDNFKKQMQKVQKSNPEMFNQMVQGIQQQGQNQMQQGQQRQPLMDGSGQGQGLGQQQMMQQPQQMFLGGSINDNNNLLVNPPNGDPTKPVKTLDKSHFALSPEEFTINKAIWGKNTPHYDPNRYWEYVNQVAESGNKPIAKDVFNADTWQNKQALYDASKYITRDEPTFNAFTNFYEGSFNKPYTRTQGQLMSKMQSVYDETSGEKVSKGYGYSTNLQSAPAELAFRALATNYTNDEIVALFQSDKPEDKKIIEDATQDIPNETNLNDLGKTGEISSENVNNQVNQIGEQGYTGELYPNQLKSFGPDYLGSAVSALPNIGMGIAGYGLANNLDYGQSSAFGYSPDYVDPTRAIQEVRDQYGGAKNQLRQASRGAGNYMSNLIGATAGESKATAGIHSQYDNINTGISNQAATFNAQQAQRANALNTQINMQEQQDITGLKQNAIQNIGVGLNTGINTFLQSKRNADMMNIAGGENFYYKRMKGLNQAPVKVFKGSEGRYHYYTDNDTNEEIFIDANSGKQVQLNAAQKKKVRRKKNDKIKDTKKTSENNVTQLGNVKDINDYTQQDWDDFGIQLEQFQNRPI